MDSLAQFSRIEIAGGLKVILSQAPSCAVRIEGNSQLVRLAVQGSTLQIRRQPLATLLGAFAKITVHVALPIVTGVRINRGSKAELRTTSPISSLELELRGGSKFYADVVGVKVGIDCRTGSKLEGIVVCEQLVAEIHGGSKVDLIGSSSYCAIEATGGSSFASDEFTCDHAEIEGSGGSKVHITVHEAFNASLSSGSTLRHFGPGRAEQSTLSGGSALTPGDGLLD